MFVPISDTHTKIDLPNVKRYDCTNLTLMDSVSVCNYNTVKNLFGKIVLLGADHLFVGKVENLFEDEFDIAFLIVSQHDKENKKNINNTIVLINKNKRNANDIDNFFEQRKDIALRLPITYRNWFADQKSIGDLLEQENVISKFRTNGNTNCKWKNLNIKLIPWGKKYLKLVNKDGRYKIDNNDVIIDFCGGPEIKKYLLPIYNKIVSNNN